MSLLESNRLQGGNSNSASRQANHHIVPLSIIFLQHHALPGYIS